MLYISNKYTRWYYNIIQSAQNRYLEPGTYVEKHHIIPRSLGGGNEVTNLVPLTAREHFICHLLLTKMCTGKDQHSMIRAARFMARLQKGIRVPSRTYAYLKEQAAPFSEEHKKKIGEANKKKGQDPDFRRKMRESAKKAQQSRTFEERSAARKKGAETRAQTMTPEQLSARGKKAAKTRAQTTTHEQRSASAKKSVQSQTPEQRSAARKKAWETRRLNASRK